MEGLEKQLRFLESKLTRMNKIGQSGAINEDGTAEVVKNQLKKQIANIRKRIMTGEK